MKAIALSLLCATATLAADPFVDGHFRWKVSEPLIDVGSGKEEADPHLAIKDPTVVFHEGKWHVIGTLRKKSGQVMMEQLSFTDWQHANEAPRTIINLHDAYHCAPEAFWFTPHQKVNGSIE